MDVDDDDDDDGGGNLSSRDAGRLKENLKNHFIVSNFVFLLALKLIIPY